MNNSVSTITGKTKIKIVLLGNQSVGKSSAIDRYVNGKFDENEHPTVGIDYLAKTVTHKGKMYRLQLWDTAGQQRFKSLIPGYLRDAQCSLIMFDVTCRSSLNNAESWLSLYNENKTGDGFTVLVGNKIDLHAREVTESQARQKARDLNIVYYQISAKTGENIEALFENIIDFCIGNGENISFSKHEQSKSNTHPEAIKEENEEEQGKDNIVLKKQSKQQNANEVQVKRCC